MNSLTTYWLSRTPGAAAEGPFTLGQIRKMYDGGAITAEAQICRNGEEEWTSIDDELAACELERAPVTKAAEAKPGFGKVQRKRQGRVGCFLFCVAIISGIFNPLAGLGIFLVSLIVDFMEMKTVCSLCGNGVERSSKSCPTCRAHLG